MMTRTMMAAAAAVGSLLITGAAPPAQAAGVVLAPHRAVYELSLLRAQGKRPVRAVRGRILYDFSGSACDGYALNFRQVSELDSGEGKTALSDLRASTWEEGGAKRFRFNSQNFINERPGEAVDGNAERLAPAVAAGHQGGRDDRRPEPEPTGVVPTSSDHRRSGRGHLDSSSAGR